MAGYLVDTGHIVNKSDAVSVICQVSIRLAKITHEQILTKSEASTIQMQKLTLYKHNQCVHDLFVNC